MNNSVIKRAIEQAAHNYKKVNMHPDHFKEFGCLTDKEKDLVMKHIAIGEKKENIVVVMNTAPFFWYRKGFAITVDRIYFSKDFFILNNHELRYIKFEDFDEIETLPGTNRICFSKGINFYTLCVGSYVSEIYNFFEEFFKINKSWNKKTEQQAIKNTLERIETLTNVEKANKLIEDLPYFDRVSPTQFKLGDIVETKDGLFGISSIYEDIKNAKVKFYGHNLTKQKWDGIEFDIISDVNRLKRDRLKIGKVKCEVDFLDVYLHFPNGKTIVLGDDCVHKIDEDNTPREVFYYEYDDCVYFATSEIDNECANKE